MSFRVMNIGKAEIFSDAIAENYRKNSDNPAYSQTGTAFSINSTSDIHTVIKLPNAITTDIWFKLDLFVDSTSNYSTGFQAGMWSRTDTYANRNFYWLNGIYMYDGQIRLNLNGNYSNSNNTARVDLKKQALNKIWCHLHNETGTNASYGELLVNGTEKQFFYTRSSSAYAIDSKPEAAYRFAFLFPNSPTCYISNIIISDEYINPKEQIIKLPISSTESDMTFDSETGIYTATATNQSLLSAVNVNALAEEYGSDSTVTGVALVGNPAYKTAEGLSSLTAFSKDSSGNATNYGTYALGSDSSGVIADSQILTGKTISDLQNLKFGWIAK